MQDFDKLKFKIYGTLISVKDIKNYPPDFKKKFEEMIQNYYIKIRHYTCDNFCGADRGYDTVLARLDKDSLKEIMPELTSQHIDFILQYIKILNPLLK